jgi:hypothetical protein
MSGDLRRGMIATVTGFVTEITDASIVVACDKQLHPDIELREFRIDLLGRGVSGFNKNFDNLHRLMSNERDTGITETLRKSIIMKLGVRYDRAISISKLPDLINLIAEMQLSRPSRTVLARTISTNHYCLIRPVSRETCHYDDSGDHDHDDDERRVFHFIATFLKATKILNLRVLVTTSSTAMLDRLSLHALANNHVDYCQLGKGGDKNRHSSVQQLKTFYSTQSVILGTISQVVTHPSYEMNPDPFDYCLLLEDGQGVEDSSTTSLLTTSIGPLFRSQRFLLFRVGTTTGFTDDYSLFHRLATPHNVLFV